MGLTLNWKILQSYLGEFAASFGFGFAVYGAIIGATLTESLAGPLIVGLTVALSSTAIIYAFADITIAHFNPAITFAAIITSKIGLVNGIMYMIAQFLGFMVAAAVVLGCYPGDSGLLIEIIRPKKVSDDVTRGELICTEMFLTGILVYIAFAVAINSYRKPKYVPSGEERLLPGEDPVPSPPDRAAFAPLAIGLTLGFLAFLGLSSSGGAFNPGIVWAPVLYSGRWIDSWAYWLGEFAGGAAGALIQVYILAKSY
jgi:aquaporin related protein